MYPVAATVVVIIFGCAFWKLLLWFRNYCKLLAIINKIPGPRSYPFIGNAHILARDFAAFHKQFLAFSEEYRDRPIFRIWLGTVPLLICHTRESIEPILSTSVHINKSIFYRFVEPWLGLGLLTSGGAQWKAQRKFLTPAFHFQILNDFVPIFNEQSKILVNILSRQANTGATFDIFPAITLATLDIICETAMGKAIQAQTNGNSSYVNAVLKLSEDVMNRIIRPWMHPDFLYRISQRGRLNYQCLKLVHEFRTNIIRERKLATANHRATATSDLKTDSDTETSFKKKRRLAFLDLLLEYQTSSNTITDDNIGEQVDTFMFEGHDTTAAAITWTLYLLGRHPDVQTKVHLELDDLFEKEPHRNIEVSDTNKMPYLEKVIKETLRLFPSVPYIGRQAEKDITLCGHHVPKGAQLLMLFTGLHRNRNAFPDPDAFRPERFDPGDSRHVPISPFAYLPFSAGPRNCIGAKFAGMEEKIVLASVLRRFRVEAIQDVDQVAPSAELILRPSKDVLVKLFERSN